MRSTRIRTNERTLVTIPNGDFASRQIENFATRDRYLFAPVVQIAYCPPAKLRNAIDLIERIVTGHEKISKEGPRARLARFGESSLDIEVFSYIDVVDFNESVTIRQELLLAIYEQLAEAGIDLAYPTRTVFLANAGEPIEVQDHRTDHSTGPTS